MTPSGLTSPPINGEERTALRKALRGRRAALSAQERIAAATALVGHIEKIPEFLTDPRIGGYWAVEGELPLAALMQGLRSRGQIWHLPIVALQRRLEFAPWQAGAALTTNRYGIPEPIASAAQRVAPQQLDVVLVPLLGFDRSGHRLGFGGGYYDRSFAFLKDRIEAHKPLLVGIGYALQEVREIVPMPWDLRLDYVVTEHELIQPQAHAEATPV